MSSSTLWSVHPQLGCTKGMAVCGCVWIGAGSFRHGAQTCGCCCPVIPDHGQGKVVYKYNASQNWVKISSYYRKQCSSVEVNLSVSIHSNQGKCQGVQTPPTLPGKFTQ